MAGEMAPRFVRKPRSTEVVEGDLRGHWRSETRGKIN